MLLPAVVAEFLKGPEGDLLREDVQAWAKWYGHNSWYSTDEQRRMHLDVEWHCSRLFEIFPEFRSLFDYRVKGIPSLVKLHYDQFKRATDLIIAATSIGPRFRIQHGHGTYIFSREIGADFWINQLVTVGSAGGVPRIGNNVQIRTGAVVVGPIEIGDGVRIGANAVVNFDLLDGQKAYAPRALVK
ncbi:MAG: hypothetical protein ABL907_02030 [Hyphomicrobium sp.]